MRNYCITKKKVNIIATKNVKTKEEREKLKKQRALAKARKIREKKNKILNEIYKLQSKIDKLEAKAENSYGKDAVKDAVRYLSKAADSFRGFY